MARGVRVFAFDRGDDAFEGRVFGLDELAVTREDGLHHDERRGREREDDEAVDERELTDDCAEEVRHVHSGNVRPELLEDGRDSSPLSHGNATRDQARVHGAVRDGERKRDRAKPKRAQRRAAMFVPAAHPQREPESRTPQSCLEW